MILSPQKIRALEKHMMPNEKLVYHAIAGGYEPLFTPNVGPQTEAFNCQADITGYGGAAGGGKSMLVTGLAMTSHKRSLIIRQLKTSTNKFIQDIAKAKGNRDGYSSQGSTWNFTGPDAIPRVIEFAGLENPGDEEKQQGIDYDLKCVGAGTLVWMADGSRKRVENVAVGDIVYTLIGPRRVTRTIRQTKEAVIAATPTGQQVQGASHQLLGPAGWRSSEDDEDRQRTPIYLLEDEVQRTRTHNRRTWSYDHPYTKEKQTTDCRVRAEAVAYSGAGVLPLFDLTVEGANHYITNQGFVNRNCYDEVTQMREWQVRYTMGWVRSDDDKQRTRVLMTFNPPTTAEGRWVIKFFAPWLDPKHPNPAKDGESRYFATKGDNPDYEVADNRPFVWQGATLDRPDGDGTWIPNYDYDPADYGDDKQILIIKPKSRTFITARVTDNPYYVKSGYISQLQQLPEPLRSQMLRGDFAAGVEDAAFQVIPTAWVEAAMERWYEPQNAGEMTSMGVDAARGGNMGSTMGAVGKDKMVISRRHGPWFAPLIAIKGVDTNSGALTAAHVIRFRRDDAPVHFDVVGIGTSGYDHLDGMAVHTIAINGAAASQATDKSGILSMYNLRAELYWAMRMALDPANPDPIYLPDDAELLADLCAPTYKVTPRGILIESKEELAKRLQRSPDKGDAVVMANIYTPKRKVVVGPLAAAADALQDYEKQRFRELEK